MARRRLFAPQLPAAAGKLTLDEASRHHAQVLRLHEGDELRLFDARGTEANARVVRSDRRELSCQVELPELMPTPAERLQLAVCVPKAAKLELIVRMATELGVSGVQLVASERAVPRYNSDAPKLERLQRIAIEACAQSEQAYAPELQGPMPLCDALASIASGSLKLACVERSDVSRSMPLSAAQGVALVWVLVGPEGGFAADELELLVKHDIAAISLGRSILRVETACVAACALLLDRMRTPA
jgi:16S rRNA (uracil1498-N3)-methyltransferase